MSERDDRTAVGSRAAGAPAPRPLVPAVVRAVAILGLLADEREPLGISDIARRLELPKSSVANLCGALVDTELLRARPGGFSLGQRLAQLGAAYLAGVDEVQLFHEACAHLEAARDETAQLALLNDGIDVVYLARRDGAYPVRLASTIGRALPANCAAAGKAMLACLDDDDLTRRLGALDELPGLTPASITSPAALRRELAEIRRVGHAVDRQEVVEGVVCVACAVPGASASGQRLAVSVTVLTPRATEDLLAAIVDELGALTTRIAERLGRTAVAAHR